MPTSEELLSRGQEVRRQLAGGGAFRPSVSNAYRVAPGLERLVTEALFGGIWGRPQLELRLRSLVTLSALTVLGWELQLRGHVRNALHLGLTPAQVAEVPVHLVWYGGLPASLNALEVMHQVFQERPEWREAAARIQEAPPAAPLEERVQRGWQMRQQLWGEAGRRMAVPAVEELAPEFTQLILGYLFGEVYYRPNLDLKQRSVCTLSALTVLGREPQLRSHLRAALRVGLSRQEVVEVLVHTTFYGGLPAALNALRVAQEVFAEGSPSRT